MSVPAVPSTVRHSALSSSRHGAPFSMPPSYPVQMHHIPTHYMALLCWWSSLVMEWSLLSSVVGLQSPAQTPLSGSLPWPLSLVKISCSFLCASQRFTVTSTMHLFRKTFTQRRWYALECWGRYTELALASTLGVFRPWGGGWVNTSSQPLAVNAKVGVGARRHGNNRARPALVDLFAACSALIKVKILR